MAIDQIRISEDDQDKLVLRLQEMIGAAEEFHSNWEQLHKIYWQQYFCQPDNEVRTWPWRNASNLFLPLGRVVQDGIMSQLHDSLFANDPIVKVRSAKSKSVHRADILSLFYGQYVFKKIVPIREIGNEWNFNCCTDGTGVVRPRWERLKRIKRDITAQLAPVYGETPAMDAMGMVPTQPQIEGLMEVVDEDVKIDVRERPVVDVMDLARLFVAPDTVRGLQYPDCPWYFVKTFLTWDELVERRRHGYENIDDELKTRMSPRSPDEIERLKRQNEDLGEGKVLDTSPIYEFYMRLVLPCTYYDEDGEKQTQKFMDEDGYSEECVVTYLGDTHKISRIVPLWRIHPSGKRPDIANFFNRIPGRFYGQGIQAKMRHLNAMINSAFNQKMDYGTLQNMPYYFYVPHLAQMPNLLSVSPGEGIPVGDTRGVQIPRMNGDTAFWTELIQLGQQWAERDGNISDQMVGRVPEKAANKTFRGMALVQQMANKSFRRVAGLMAEPYVELLYDIHGYYLRNAPPELIFRVTDEQGLNFEDIRMSREDLDQEIEFEMVFNPDRQSEQQVAQALFQLVTQIPYVAQNPFSVRAAAKHLYETIGEGSGRRNFEEIWPESMTPQIVAQQQQQAMMQRGQPSQFPGRQGQQQAPPQQQAPQQPQMQQQQAPQVAQPRLQIIRNQPDDDELGVELA